MTEPQPPYLDYPEYPDLSGYGWRPPPPPPATSAVEIVVRIVGGTIGVGACGLWLLLSLVVLGSLYSSDPASDPHGYGVIFGTLVGVPCGIVGAAVLPLALPQRLWARGYLVVLPSFVVLLGCQFLAMHLS